ncbi:MAG: hypothetical protein ACLQGP_28835 [Isosphaeraceae bacterium]
MGRRIRRGLRPDLESIEPRVLLSAITDLLAGNGLHGKQTASASTNLAGGGGSGSGTASGGGFSASVSLGSQTLNQGPLLNADGTINNMAIAPTGNPKPGLLKKEQFSARYVGPYSVVPGKTTTQSTQTLIQGAGTANTMLHSDMQMRLVTPTDPSLPIGGVTSIFDRNINTNTVLGLDLSVPQTDVDQAGRPDSFSTVTLDSNISSGVYVEGYSQGTVTIRYIPGGRHTIPGAISQGTAIVTIHAQIYSSNASFLLRNVSLNP